MGTYGLNDSSIGSSHLADLVNFINNSSMDASSKSVFLNDVCKVYEAYYGLEGLEMSDAVALDELDIIQHDLREASREEPQATAGAEKEDDGELDTQEGERKRADDRAYVLAAERAAQLIRRVQRGLISCGVGGSRFAGCGRP